MIYILIPATENIERINNVIGRILFNELEEYGVVENVASNMLPIKQYELGLDILAKSDNVIYTTYSEHFIRALQVLIAQGKVDTDKCKVLWIGDEGERKLIIYSNGSMRDVPKGMFDATLTALLDMK